MKFNKLIVLPLIAMLGACSTTYEPNTDHNASYNFSEVESFNVVGDDHLKNPMISDINRQRIDSAVTNALTEQGKIEASEKNADVLISYFVVTKDKMKVSSSYAGHYGRYGAYGYGGASHVDVRNYVEGTLVIDMIDNETKTSVWRSTLTKSLKNYDNAQERDEAIQKAVNSMINTVPNVKQVS